MKEHAPMARVRILPDILANKIAAGEVVERPASVVKELVENALDAGSRRITVDIEAGGRALIQVADDGSGMLRDDALLALERHATSKIARDEDLAAIVTLGFRGEALPSMAAVSRFTMVTRPAEAEAGTEIRMAGGKLEDVRMVGAPSGTLVRVADLFFNTPARRKFLKSMATEMGHIGDTLASLALAHPQVHFRLTHNRRRVKDWPAVGDPLDRAVDVLGGELRGELLPLGLEAEGVAVTGWIAGPRAHRATARALYTFVNGRFVRDRTVQHAVLHGGRERFMRGQYPVAVCFLHLPPGDVDVNVHPAKHEVRFARQAFVHGIVAGAVAAALAGAGGRPAPSRSEAGPRVAESIGPYLMGTPPPAHRPPPRPTDPDRPTHLPSLAAGGLQPGLWRASPFRDLVFIGQFRDTYLVCEGADELVIIDQHAAHERITYEQLRRRAEAGNAAAQRLAVPETLDLDFREAALLTRLAPELTRIGLAVEPFGGTTFIVSAVPAHLTGGAAGPALRALLAELLDSGADPALEATFDHCLKLMACHGSIRARQALDARQVRRLLAQLDECHNPGHCPHGRPTWVRWSRGDLEKAFGRQK
jgi:DNA mismatch repair protein MutL